MLDKKLIQLIFLFQFKMGHKAAETTCNINNPFGQGSANECTVQRWFKKFCKGDESLEDEECSGQPSEVDNDNWEPSLKLILTTTWEVDEELNINHFNVMQLLKQIGKVKKLPKCEPQWADQKSKKSSFWSVISPYFMQQQIIFWLDCNRWWEVDFIQLAMTSSVPGQRSSSKALPKAKLIPKKGNGHCLVVCCPSDPLQLSESWQNHYIRSMLNKSKRCTKNCKACRWPWSTEWAQFFSMTTPNRTLHNQCFKSWTNCATKFCLIHHIHLTSSQPTTTSSSTSTTFCRENAFQEFVKSQSMDFYATGVDKLISHWQKCVSDHEF